MQFSVRALAAMAIMCTAGMANAGIITIDLRGNGGNLGQTTTFSNGAVSLDVFGYAVRNNGNGVASNIHQNNRGLGIRRGNNQLNNDGGTDRWFSEFLSMLATGGEIVGVGLRGLGRGEEAGVGSSRTQAALPGTTVLRLVAGRRNQLTWFAPRALRRRDYGVVGVSDLSPLTRFRVQAVRVAVPEPGALGLAALGLVLLARRRVTR